MILHSVSDNDSGTVNEGTRQIILKINKYFQYYRLAQSSFLDNSHTYLSMCVNGATMTVSQLKINSYHAIEDSTQRPPEHHHCLQIAFTSGAFPITAK